MNYGGDYLDNVEADVEEDNYDWGNNDEKIEKMLMSLRDKPTLLEKFNAGLREIRNEKNLDLREKMIQGFKFELEDTVENLKIADKLNDEYWEDKIRLEENEKFLWEQKLNNVNEALEESGIKLDLENRNLYNYLKENLTETFIPSDKEKKEGKNINGYMYAGKKIIQRGKDKVFHFVENKEFNNFLERMKKFTIGSARSEIVDILKEDVNVEETARECIEELRDMEKRFIRGMGKVEDINNVRGEIGRIEENIDDTKNNRKISGARGLIDGTLQGKLMKLKGWVEDNKTTLGVGGSSLLLSIISGLATTIPLVDKMKNAAKNVVKMKKAVEKFGKDIKKIGRELGFLGGPVKATGEIFVVLSSIIGNLGKLWPLLIIVPIIGAIGYIINKWIGVF